MKIGDNDKYQVQLKELTQAQKEHAYRIMGYVLLEYESMHTISGERLQRLLTVDYVKDYKKVTIIY